MQKAMADHPAAKPSVRQVERATRPSVSIGPVGMPLISAFRKAQVFTSAATGLFSK